jgi:hypothetical protein
MKDVVAEYPEKPHKEADIKRKVCLILKIIRIKLEEVIKGRKETPSNVRLFLKEIKE